ncbi:MAG: hypothetical protein JWO56_3678, partial [Acidobacteria bacterium]|nr:hypothetical protein [Acidobacteriota bacterium]
LERIRLWITSMTYQRVRQALPSLPGGHKVGSAPVVAFLRGAGLVIMVRDEEDNIWVNLYPY